MSPKLNEVQDEEGLQKFEAELMDRFGELPEEAQDLLNSVRIKWIATHIGLEKVIMKKGKFIGYFIADQQSNFYQSPVFTQVLQYVQSHPQQAKLKESLLIQSAQKMTTTTLSKILNHLESVILLRFIHIMSVVTYPV